MNFVFPYPISANRYWRTYLPKGHRVPVTTVSKEAKAYKETVRRILASEGVDKPVEGIVSVCFTLYPRRPKDWMKRMRIDPYGWHRNVQCIDLDNAQKVLLDAMKGIAFEDDDLVWFICGQRGVPDEKGARVEIRIRKYADDEIA